MKVNVPSSIMPHLLKLDHAVDIHSGLLLVVRVPERVSKSIRLLILGTLKAIFFFCHLKPKIHLRKLCQVLQMSRPTKNNYPQQAEWA